MIKLICSDMDGTLLNDKKQLPDNFFDILKELKERNIEFVVCSGRSYVILKLDFEEILNDMIWICDNGAYIMSHGKNIYTSIIDKNLWLEVVEKCKQIQGIQLILSGVSGTYYTRCSEDFQKMMELYFPNRELVEDLSKVEDDIFKVTVCDSVDPKDNSFKLLNDDFKDKLSLQISGPFFLDLMNKGINKGKGVEKIQELTKATFDETMVFGDYYNDISMFSKAKYSFVMENANDDVKKYGKFIAKNNNEHGVIKAIEEYVLKK